MHCRVWCGCGRDDVLRLDVDGDLTVDELLAKARGAARETAESLVCDEESCRFCFQIALSESFTVVQVPSRVLTAREEKAILRLDPCAYCGAKCQHLDHIEPRSQGGPDGWDNLTAACAPCNHAKRAKPLLLHLLTA